MKKIVGTLVAVGALVAVNALGAPAATAGTPTVRNAWASALLSQTSPSTATATGCLSTIVSVRVNDRSDTADHGGTTLWATDSCTASDPYAGGTMFWFYLPATTGPTVDSNLGSGSYSDQIAFDMATSGPTTASVRATWTGVGKIMNGAQMLDGAQWVRRQRSANASIVVDLNDMHIVISGSLGVLEFDTLTAKV